MRYACLSVAALAALALLSSSDARGQCTSAAMSGLGHRASPGSPGAYGGGPGATLGTLNSGGGGGGSSVSTPDANRGSARSGGGAMSFVGAAARGRTSRDLLVLDWSYPVFASDRAALPGADATSDGSWAAASDVVVEANRSVAVAAGTAAPSAASATAGGRAYAAPSHTTALSREAALADVIGDDPRPLLVLRECAACQGSDDALLSTRFDNERTVLLSSWFHMVKLPNHVLETDHPYRQLFDEHDPAHLFVAMPDGSDAIRLSGGQSPSDLWDAMTGILERSYGDEVEHAVSQRVRLLDAFDELDREEALLFERYDDELERKGPRSSKLKKMRKDIDALAAERVETRAAWDAFLELPIAMR